MFPNCDFFMNSMCICTTLLMVFSCLQMLTNLSNLFAYIFQYVWSNQIFLSWMVSTQGSVTPSIKCLHWVHARQCMIATIVSKLSKVEVFHPLGRLVHNTHLQHVFYLTHSFYLPIRLRMACSAKVQLGAHSLKLTPSKTGSDVYVSV